LALFDKSTRELLAKAIACVELTFRLRCCETL